jgi:hypothetical protein
MQAPRFVFIAFVFAVLAVAGGVSAQAQPAPVPPTIPPITISL